MQEGLLRTKFYIPPPRPELVPRPRLTKQLTQGLQRKLTLISAPAGFGKTSLVSEWLNNIKHKGQTGSQNPIGIAWLSLDDNDNDPTRFLAYLAGTLYHVDGGETQIGKGTLGMLQSPQPPTAEPILTSLINDISFVPQNIILILDDYHLIDSLPVDEALAFLIKHLPPKMHLVIVTRIDPNLPIARLRASGQLTELRAADLRFTSSETAKFINDVMDLRLSAENITALEASTEGWIAGLQLAALALQRMLSRQGSEEAHNFIRSFTGSHRYIMDYLVDEVLEKQSENTQKFLLETAILDRFSAPLCDALTGQKNSKATLELLEQNNLFIIPLDEKRDWYRYHHLFADLLRQNLRRTQPERLPNLHIRASKWFNCQGLHREAIKHSLAARDYQGAAQLIKTEGIDVLQYGEQTTLARWINSLPEEIVKEEPYLSVLHAWALMLNGHLEFAETRLVEADSAMEDPKFQDNGDRETISALIDSHRAYLAFMTGELDQTILYAQKSLDYLPESASLIRLQTALYLGIANRYRGQLQPAMDIYNEVLPVAQRMGGTSIAVLSHLHLGDLYAELGQLHRAKEIYERALEITENHAGRSDLPMCGYVYVSIGRLLRQWNQLEEAYSYTTKGVALCRDWKVADIMALSHIELAYLQQALKDDEQSRQSMLEAIRIYESFSLWGVKYGNGHQARIDLMRGEIDTVKRWAAANDLVLDGDFEFHREIEYLALARLLIAERRIEEAHFLVTRIYRVAQESGKRVTELEGLILLALLNEAQGKTEQALDYLEKALSMAEPEGFIRVFADEGAPMAHLLQTAFDRDIATDYVSHLLAAFLNHEPVHEVTSQPDQTNLVEPLSDRELEVLQHIAEGLTNREIAKRLYLSLNTVKVHTRNIYGKLDVHSRTQAVAQAQELGLL